RGDGLAHHLAVAGQRGAGVLRDLRRLRGARRGAGADPGRAAAAHHHRRAGAVRRDAALRAGVPAIAAERPRAARPALRQPPLEQPGELDGDRAAVRPVSLAILTQRSAAMSDTIFDPRLLRPRSAPPVHPLDDAPEEKLFHAGLGRMPLTRSVKASLLLLQAHLALMLGLIVWRLLTLAGFV